MILSYQTIKKFCVEENMIEPWSERTIHEGMSYGLGPCTYDFRLDKILTEDNRLVNEHLFIPGEAILVSTIEAVRMPNNICASVLDKSTLARKFISAFNTHFDPGFVGYPTIELVNLGGYDVLLKHGIPICQFKFEFLDEPTTDPYRGKYQYQVAVPVEARDERHK